MTACQYPSCTPTPSPTYSEDHRAKCEARFVCSLPTLESRKAYLSMVERKRGQAATESLKKEVAEEWKKSQR